MVGSMWIDSGCDQLACRPSFAPDVEPTVHVPITDLCRYVATTVALTWPQTCDTGAAWIESTDFVVARVGDDLLSRPTPLPRISVWTFFLMDGMTRTSHRSASVHLETKSPRMRSYLELFKCALHLRQVLQRARNTTWQQMRARASVPLTCPERLTKLVSDWAVRVEF